MQGCEAANDNDTCEYPPVGALDAWLFETQYPTLVCGQLSASNGQIQCRR